MIKIPITPFQSGLTAAFNPDHVFTYGVHKQTLSVAQWNIKTLRKVGQFIVNAPTLNIDIDCQPRLAAAKSHLILTYSSDFIKERGGSGSYIELRKPTSLKKNNLLDRKNTKQLCYKISFSPNDENLFYLDVGIGIERWQIKNNSLHHLESINIQFRDFTLSRDGKKILFTDNLYMLTQFHLADDITEKARLLKQENFNSIPYSNGARFVDKPLPYQNYLILDFGDGFSLFDETRLINKIDYSSDTIAAVLTQDWRILMDKGEIYEFPELKEACETTHRNAILQNTPINYDVANIVLSYMGIFAAKKTPTIKPINSVNERITQYKNNKRKFEAI